MTNTFKNTLAVLDTKERRRLSLLVLLDIFISIIDIASLALLLWIIQFYIQPGQSNTISSLPQWLTDKNTVTPIAVFVIFFAVKNWAAFLIARSFYSFSSKVAVRISHGKLQQYQNGSFEEFIYKDSSAHIRNICFQPFEYCQYMLSGIQDIIMQTALIGVTIIAILIFNAKLFLLLLIILLPPVIVVFYFIKKRLAGFKKHIRENNERSLQYLLDALKGYVEGNIYHRNDFFLQRFVRFRKKFSSYLFDTLALQTLPNRVIEIFAVLGLFILVAIAKWTANGDNATLLTIGAFMAAAYKIIPGVVKMINISAQMKAYEFSINDVVEKENIKASTETTLPATIHSIELKEVSFKYADQQVLHNFSLMINRGDFIGIGGKSGKGKTTILNLLLGFLPASGGEVIINDKPVDTENLKMYWPQIAYVRQQAFFIHDTLLKNITLEENGCDDKKLQCALTVSGLDDLVTKSPEGVQKIITENGKNISGGQQQRVCIARALYKNAPVILLDEPFNELDENSAAIMLDHLKTLTKTGSAVVLITHDKKNLSYCNKIISLDE